ncbi:MAG: GNAT family N-acetyltransferase [Prolixibacteraceae bacterium]|jgi:GNAT superfamily N-acetyltransferase|nr:GNAT family N-acetyltransferase [Prolixibacteraceae bacterium]
MKLIEVKTKRSKKLFNKLPRILYRKDPNFACPLTKMVEENFDREKNSFYKHGIGTRWILTEGNKPIGRIAAFIDFDKAHIFEQPTGNIGFFECINDKEAASILFDTAKEWLHSHGMEAMDGPANMGENYMNHGLLSMGFTTQGFGMPYNPTYYLELFESYGFKVYYEQYSYHLNYKGALPERFRKIAEWVAKKPQYSFKHFSWDKIDSFINDFSDVYKGAWSKHEHFKAIDKSELRSFLESSKLLLDPEFVWFAYANNEAIAMFVMLPDFNQALQHIKNGKLSPWNMIKLMRFIKRGKFTRGRILIMGVVDKYQRSGVESALFWQIENKVLPKKPKYKEIELSWAGDFNPKIIALYKSTGAKHAKTHYQMRYLFDRNKIFKRAKLIE